MDNHDFFLADVFAEYKGLTEHVEGETLSIVLWLLVLPQVRATVESTKKKLNFSLSCGAAKFVDRCSLIHLGVGTKGAPQIRRKQHGPIFLCFN